MPRRSAESAIALAICRFARRNAAFKRLPSRLIDGSNGNGQVRFLSAPAVSAMKRLDGFHGEARGDLAGHVPAHAVGHDVEAEIGAGTVAILVAAAAETGVRADGPGQLHQACGGGMRCRPTRPANWLRDAT